MTCPAFPGGDQPFAAAPHRSLCLHTLADVPAAGSEVCWMRERLHRAQQKMITNEAIKCAPQRKSGGRAERMHLAYTVHRGYTWSFLRNQRYPTCGQSVQRGVGAFQPQSWAHSINSWLTICSLLFALFSSQKVFSQQTFNLCHPPPFAAEEAIINNDSGFSGHHLHFPGACSDLNL